MSHEDFEIIDKLGNGALGTVFLVKEIKTGNLFALKMYKEGSKIKALEESNEISLKFHHPNLMITNKIFSDIVITEGDESTFSIGKATIHLFSLMECINGENLHKMTLRYAKENRLNIMTRKMDLFIPQIVDALKYLHSHNIIHRDIKPENMIVFDKNTIKIIDYDFLIDISKEENNKATGILGTPYFISPEMYLGKYDTKVDLWALGVTIYFCLRGVHPFNARNRKELQEIVLTNGFEPSYSNIPFKFIQIINGLLQKDPSFRISLNNVMRLLK